MIAKYKWYFVGAAVVLIGFLVYRKFIRKTPKLDNPAGANEGDLTVTDSVASTKEMKERILRQDLDQILN